MRRLTTEGVGEAGHRPGSSMTGVEDRSRGLDRRGTPMTQVTIERSESLANLPSPAPRDMVTGRDL
jgi:hypothetical protein